MKPGMPEAKAPKLYLGVHARLVFLKKEDEHPHSAPPSLQEVISPCPQ
jgi:hypothetical protein